MAVFLWAWCLCAALVEPRNMAKAPRQLVLTSPQFEPLTLGPLRYRNDATSREQAISTIIDRRLPSRRSQVETGYIRIAEPRPVRNCAFSDLTVGFMAAGHRLSGQVSRPWTVFGVEEAGWHAVETPRLLQYVLQNGGLPPRSAIVRGSRFEERATV